MHLTSTLDLRRRLVSLCSSCGCRGWRNSFSPRHMLPPWSAHANPVAMQMPSQLVQLPWVQGLAQLVPQLFRGTNDYGT